MDLADKSKKKLRTGFTTGTCATASSKAALLAVIEQKSVNDVDAVSYTHLTLPTKA